jgi:hypothetical protein
VTTPVERGDPFAVEMQLQAAQKAAVEQWIATIREIADIREEKP